MLEEGLLSEVKLLQMKEKLSAQKVVASAIGYRQALTFLSTLPNIQLDANQNIIHISDPILPSPSLTLTNSTHTAASSTLSSSSSTSSDSSLHDSSSSSSSSASSLDSSTPFLPRNSVLFSTPSSLSLHPSLQARRIDLWRMLIDLQSVTRNLVRKQDIWFRSEKYFKIISLPVTHLNPNQPDLTLPQLLITNLSVIQKKNLVTTMKNQILLPSHQYWQKEIWGEERSFETRGKNAGEIEEDERHLKQQLQIQLAKTKQKNTMKSSSNAATAAAVATNSSSSSASPLISRGFSARRHYSPVFFSFSPMNRTHIVNYDRIIWNTATCQPQIGNKTNNNNHNNTDAITINKNTNNVDKPKQTMHSLDKLL